MIFTRARNLEDGVCTECFFVLSTECWVLRTIPYSLQVPYGGTQISHVASPVHQQPGTRKFAHWPQEGDDEGF